MLQKRNIFKYKFVHSFASVRTFTSPAKWSDCRGERLPMVPLLLKKSKDTDASKKQLLKLQHCFRKWKADPVSSEVAGACSFFPPSSKITLDRSTCSFPPLVVNAVKPTFSPTPPKKKRKLKLASAKLLQVKDISASRKTLLQLFARMGSNHHSHFNAVSRQRARALKCSLKVVMNAKHTRFNDYNQLYMLLSWNNVKRLLKKRVQRGHTALMNQFYKSLMSQKAAMNTQSNLLKDRGNKSTSPDLVIYTSFHTQDPQNMCNLGNQFYEFSTYSHQNKQNESGTNCKSALLPLVKFSNNTMKPNTSPVFLVGTSKTLTPSNPLGTSKLLPNPLSMHQLLHDGLRNTRESLESKPNKSLLRIKAGDGKTVESPAPFTILYEPTSDSNNVENNFKKRMPFVAVGKTGNFGRATGDVRAVSNLEYPMALDAQCSESLSIKAHLGQSILATDYGNCHADPVHSLADNYDLYEVSNVKADSDTLNSSIKKFRNFFSFLRIPSDSSISSSSQPTSEREEETLQHASFISQLDSSVRQASDLAKPKPSYSAVKLAIKTKDELSACTKLGETALSPLIMDKNDKYTSIHDTVTDDTSFSKNSVIEKSNNSSSANLNSSRYSLRTFKKSFGNNLFVHQKKSSSATGASESSNFSQKYQREFLDSGSFEDNGISVNEEACVQEMGTSEKEKSPLQLSLESSASTTPLITVPAFARCEEDAFIQPDLIGAQSNLQDLYKAAENVADADEIVSSIKPDDLNALTKSELISGKVWKSLLQTNQSVIEADGFKEVTWEHSFLGGAKIVCDTTAQPLREKLSEHSSKLCVSNERMINPIENQLEMELGAHNPAATNSIVETDFVKEYFYNVKSIVEANHKELLAFLNDKFNLASEKIRAEEAKRKLGVESICVSLGEHRTLLRSVCSLLENSKIFNSFNPQHSYEENLALNSIKDTGCLSQSGDKSNQVSALDLKQSGIVDLVTSENFGMVEKKQLLILERLNSHLYAGGSKNYLQLALDEIEALKACNKALENERKERECLHSNSLAEFMALKEERIQGEKALRRVQAQRLCWQFISALVSGVSFTSGFFYFDIGDYFGFLTD